MKSLRITILFLSILSARAGTPTVSISTNKVFVISTNNVLAPAMTNFFTTNIYPLTNALALAGYAGGSGSSTTNFPMLDITNLLTAGKLSSDAGEFWSDGGGDVIAQSLQLLYNGTETLVLGGQINQVGGGDSAWNNFFQAGAWHDDGRGSLTISNLAAGASITAATNITAGGAFYGLNGGLTNANGNPLVDQTVTNALNTIMRAAQSGSPVLSNIVANITVSGAGVVTFNTNAFQPKTNFTSYGVLSNSISGPIVGSGSSNSLSFNADNDGLATGEFELTNHLSGAGFGLWGDSFGDLNVNFVNQASGGWFEINAWQSGAATPIISAGAAHSGSINFWQVANSAFVVLGTTNSNPGFQEAMDITPSNFVSFYGNDELVCSANSNNANIRLTADASITYGALRHNITNVSGYTSYAATMFDRIIEDNPAVAGNTTITLPAEATHGLVLPTTSEPFRAWTSQNGYVLGGAPLMAAWQTTEYWVYNLGSNTANTLTVVLPFAVTNTGLTSIIVPNQMAAHFTCTGTNGGIATAMELQPMTFSPAYNGVNITNLAASAIASGIYGNRIGFGGQDAATLPGTETAKFQPLFGIAATPQATETNSSQFLPGVALLTNLWVSVQPALGAGSNVVYIVRTNGVATGITVTITSSSTGSLGSDTAHFAWITNAVVDMNVQTTIPATSESVNWTLQY